MSYPINMDSFGSILPSNWEEIADKINIYIEETGIKDDPDACNEAWEKFFSGEIIWYAIMFDRDDTDWGYGSYNLETAKEKLDAIRSDLNWPESYILAVRDGEDPVALYKVEVD